MLAFRSITIGLLGACLYLLCGLYVDRPPRVVVVPKLPATMPSVPAETVTRTHNVTVIDVAAGLPPSTIARLIQFGDHERIAAVDDRPVGSTLEAATLISQQLERGSRLIDLTINADPTARRVLVVLH